MPELDKETIPSMPNSETNGYVEKLTLADQLDKRIALCTLRIGDVLIHGVAVWRGPGGKLRVYFPSYKLEHGWADAIELPEDLRTQVEADVIASYKQARAAAQAEQRQKGEPLHG
jgi:hypothetical protein